MNTRTHTTITDLYGHYQDLMGEAAAARSMDELREEFHARTGGNYERDGADFLDEIFEDEWAYGDVVSLEVTANAVLNCRKNWADGWIVWDEVSTTGWEKWDLHRQVDPEIFSDPTERLRRLFEIWHDDEYVGPAEVMDYAKRLVDQISDAGLEITIRGTETVKPTPRLRDAAACAVADLEGLLTQVDVDGDRTHPGWKTIQELTWALEQIEQETD